MKLHFSAHQAHQWQAVEAVVRLFEGQALAQSDFEVWLGGEGGASSGLRLSEKGIGNSLLISPEQLLQNLRAVQAENGIGLSDKLEMLPHASSIPSIPAGGIPNFTVEMETGTGKTYTFLRTMYELHKVYGFKKFVIVVPSVAIREGTIKNLHITHEHFQQLYGAPPMQYMVYERGNLGALRNFAASNAMQVLVINIDSFAKEENVINALHETGIRPIEYIQTARPVVMIDEPQNVETELRRKAIAKLNPLCILRYSATHRNLYNLVYALNPVRAYDLGLVKQIEVDGISHTPDYNTAFVQFKNIVRGKNSLKAKLSIYVQENQNIKQKDITVSVGDDLYALSNGREVYSNNFVINSIDAENAQIAFANGIIMHEGSTQGGFTENLTKYRIEQTVKWHFEKAEKLKNRNIKVLSLFFIDKVANYRTYDADGKPQKGKFALWFEEAYQKFNQQYSNVLPFTAEQVHNGYFSSDKTGKGKDKKEIWADTKGTTAKDDDTYALIMKDKERLLSIDEPLQFVFSHSALREGWDNPNVFQICTLNESQSDVKKRQIIGRGLRLAVDQSGHRVYDKGVNVLTVVASESFEEFSKALQTEIEEETSVKFEGRIKNARRQKEQILPQKNTFPQEQGFGAAAYSNEALAARAVANIKALPPVQAPQLASRKAALRYTAEGIENVAQEVNSQALVLASRPIPDVYAYVQSRVSITRASLCSILLASERYADLLVDPQWFLDSVVQCIGQAMRSLLTEAKGSG